MANLSYERELGSVQKTLEHLSENQAEIIKSSKEHRDEVDRKLDEIGKTLSGIKSDMDQMKGAWKATAIVGSIAGIVGAGAWKLASFVLTLPLR